LHNVGAERRIGH